MLENIRKARGEHPFGLTWIARRDGEHADMLMDFGVYRMHQGDVYEEKADLEKAVLLVYGTVAFDWVENGEKKHHEEHRENCFDVPPTALHADAEGGIRITCLSEEAEINILRTDNPVCFGSHLYLPAETPDEFRGAGLMRETSTRIVRTIFDYSNAPQAKLVLGEVIGFPGKWSSYPPHHHPQPEIYYYKCNPENGFGYGELGDDVVKVQNNDTVFIEPGLTHPHCTAPGYALWYLWAIRHLDGNPYRSPDYPVFLKEHLWVMDENSHYFGDPGED